jgi:hypothetical protein
MNSGMHGLYYIICIGSTSDFIHTPLAEWKLILLFLPHIGKVVNHYKGFTGAVKSVQCGPEGGGGSRDGEELVAACGLDRYLRIYTVNPPKLKHQVVYTTLLNYAWVGGEAILLVF